MTTQPISSVPSDVADFVSRVRAALADLPPDDVDELTAGLAADLADARAEAPNGWREGVGSPEAYAAELRSAAGLPPRGPVADPTALDGLRQWWASLATHPVAGPVQREAHDLAPAWWVIRGAIGGLLVTRVFLGLNLLNLVTIVVVALGAAVSVWLGRALRRGTGAGLRLLSAACTTLAVFVGLVMAANVNDSTAPMSYDSSHDIPQELMFHGETVRNMYAYGPDGQRIEEVRLFDERGNQLVVGGDFPGGVQQSFPYAEYGVTDPWAPPVEEGVWVPPMALTPLPGAISTETSTSTSDPTSSSSSSSSSGSTTKGSKAESSPKPTASPRSTASPSD